MNKAAVVVILGLLTSFAPFATDMYLSGLPAMAESFGCDAAKAQLSLSAFFLGLAVGQFFYGPISDSLGRRGPLLFGVCLFTLTALASLVTTDMDVFIGLRFLQAVGGCAGMILARAVVRDLFEGQEVARVFSLMMLVQSVGPVLAPVLGGAIMAVASWRWILVFLAAFGLVCLGLAWFGLPETLPRANRRRFKLGRSWRIMRALLVRRAFVVPMLSGGLALASIFVFISGSPFVFMQLHGVSPANYGLLFAGNAVAMTLVGQLNVVLLRRFAMGALLRGALVLACCLSVALVALADTRLPVLVAALYASLATAPLIGANATALAMTASGRSAGAASTVLGVTQFLLAAAASALVGLFQGGSARPMAGLILACVLAGTLVQFLGNRGKGLTRRGA